MKVPLPIPARSSILRHACPITQEKGYRRFEPECSSDCCPFDRPTDSTKRWFGAVKSRRKKTAQRSSIYSWQAGRQQGRQGTSSEFVGRQTSGNCAPRSYSAVGKAVTTIVALAARDFILVGCDSLATTSADLVFPAAIAATFFEPTGEIKKDADGITLLQNARQIWEKAQSMPVDQLPSVTKLYDLEPMRACLLFAGASRVGNTTIWHLVEKFKTQAEIPDAWMRPTMEAILSGYSTEFREPELWRLTLSYDRVTTEFKCDIQDAVKRGEFNVIFGGQYDVIQRVVNGIDWPSYCSLRQRTVDMLNLYHDEIQAKAHADNAELNLAKPDFYDQKYSIFGNDQGGVTRIFSDVGSLSEQAGIDFVYFLIDVMIKAQGFSSSIATVGGRIHVALLTKSRAFRWISKEGFTFEREHVPKFQNA